MYIHAYATKDTAVKKAYNSSVPKSMVKAFENVPMTRSAAITQAVLNADKNPDLLAHAFRLRLSQPFEENDTKITYTRDIRLEAMVKRLAEMTKLPGEQVMRLCMEAYIHRL